MPRRFIVSLVAVLLLAAGCGEEGAPQTAEQVPERIVSLSPTSTEVLFAIGAADQVVAVDDQSDYPPEAPTTDLSGFEPNVEAIATYDPDLVVYSTDPGDLGSSLQALGIDTLQHDAVTTFEEAYAQIDELGEVTGHAEEAGALVEQMRTDVDEIVAGVDDSGLTYYHELDDQLFTVTSQTFIGQVYAQLGLENIADAAEGASSGYPQLSAEYILDADPDLIFLADTECCDITAASVAERPGWDELTAVQNGAVIELDDDIASRWGPRVVEFLEIARDAVNDVA